MVQSSEAPTASVAYGIGACFNCLNLCLVTPTRRTCPLCDSPPARVLAFVDAAGAAIEEGGVASPTEAPAAQPTVLGITCPSCHTGLEVAITEDFVDVRLRSTVRPPTDGPSLAPEPAPGAAVERPEESEGPAPAEDPAPSAGPPGEPQPV